MSILRHEPWGMHTSWPNELFRLFDTAGTVDAAASANWQPRVDILEFEDRYEIQADLPGVNPEQVDITLDNNHLTIAGRREAPASDDASKPHRLERHSGEFSRQFALPDEADSDSINARSDHGVLSVVIPKRSQPQPTKISVQH